MKRIAAPGALALALAAFPAGAQQAPVGAGQSALIGTPNYDVILEVPELTVDSIRLRVEGLTAHLALDARVANLVMITAGADVSIDQVDLQIDGVVAEAYAYIDLDNVARMVDRALTTLEQNPEILNSILATVDSAVGTVGGVAGTALQRGGVVDQAVGTVGRTLDNVSAPNGLLSSTVNTLGQTVSRVVDSTGRLLEQTTDTAGRVLNSRALGSVADLPVVLETVGAGGRVTRQVRDQTGRIIELTLDAAGRITGTRVLGAER